MREISSFEPEELDTEKTSEVIDGKKIEISPMTKEEELIDYESLMDIVEKSLSEKELNPEARAKLEMVSEEAEEINKVAPGKKINFPGKKIIAAGMLALSLIAAGTPKESHAGDGYYKGYVTGFAVTEIVNIATDAYGEKYYPEKGAIEKIENIIEIISDIDAEIATINEKRPEMEKALKDAKIKLDEAQKKYDEEYRRASSIGKFGKLLNSAPGGRPADELYKYSAIEEELKSSKLKREKLIARKAVLEGTLNVIHEMSKRKSGK